MIRIIILTIVSGIAQHIEAAIMTLAQAIEAEKKITKQMSDLENEFNKKNAEFQKAITNSEKAWESSNKNPTNESLRKAWISADQQEDALFKELNKISEKGKGLPAALRNVQKMVAEAKLAALKKDAADITKEVNKQMTQINNALKLKLTTEDRKRHEKRLQQIGEIVTKFNNAMNEAQAEVNKYK